MHKNKIEPWLIWIIGALFVLFQFLLQVSPSIMVPQMMREFNINAFQMSLFSASFFISYIVFQIPSGFLVDVMGAKKCLIASLTALLISLFCLIHTHHFFTAVLTRILSGLASAPAVSLTLKLVYDWFDRKYFALLMGLTEALGMLGGMLGQTILSYYVMKVSWKAALTGCLWINAGLLLFAFLWVKDNQDYKNNKTANINWPTVREVMLNPFVLGYGFISGALFSILSGFAGFWAVPFIHQLYEVPYHLASSISSMTFLGAAVGAFLIGMATSYFEVHKYQIIKLSICLSALLLIAIIFLFTKVWFYLSLLMFLLGLCCAGYIIPFAVIRDIVPGQICGFAMGLTNMMCILIGAAVIQPLIGWFLKTELHFQQEIHSYHLNYLGFFQMTLLILPLCLVFSLILIKIMQIKSTVSEKNGVYH